MILILIVAAAGLVAGQSRRATSDLTDTDVQTLRAAWSAAAKMPSFIALTSDPYASHGTAAFLPWHRHALNRFEDLLNVSVPYWDFSLEPIPAIAMEPRSRQSRDPNPLYSQARKPVTPYPTETFMGLEMMAFAQLDFGHVSILLENLFETVLASLGGAVATLDTAPKDALYWMTLANIDRIWWRWSLNRNATTAPAAATHELKDMTGPFSGARVVNDTSRWDPTGKYKEELAERAANPERSPTDAHIDGKLLNVSSGPHVAMMLRAGHIQAHMGPSAFSADNSERSYQGMVISGNGSSPGLGGLGMTTSDNHEWHTEDIPAPNISSKTAWDNNGTFYGAAPGSGAIHGLDGDPEPPTGNFLDGTSLSGNSMPGPTSQTNLKGGSGSTNATSPGMKGTTGKLPNTNGKGYNAVGHNTTHFTDVKPKKFKGDKSKVVASVAFSFSGNWGFHNQTGPPIYMSQTSSLPLKPLSSATHSMAIQQDTMEGDGDRNQPAIPTPGKKPNGTYPYDTVSEIFATPPKMHMILSLCEVPSTESPFRVEIVARNTVIGVILIEGTGGLHAKFQRDRPVDITDGYQKLLKSVPLKQLQEELTILMYNEKTGKMVKTPKFTVRLDQFVF